MKLHYLFLSIVQPDKIIKNINLPSCKNCIYYKPSRDDSDFISTFSKCAKFGVKDIISGKVTYDYVEFCRKDETKCGNEGKYFEEEENINWKIVKHKMMNNFSYNLSIFMLIITLYIKVLLGK